MQRAWDPKTIPDDPHPPAVSFADGEGYVSFAGSGAASRTTQIFVTVQPLPFLGKAPWETPAASTTSSTRVPW